MEESGREAKGTCGRKRRLHNRPAPTCEDVMHVDGQLYMSATRVISITDLMSTKTDTKLDSFRPCQ
jgi:hypothetical protein